MRLNHFMRDSLVAILLWLVAVMGIVYGFSFLPPDFFYTL